ncbi:MAG: tRNA (adenosine(37)-N6)-dimethylallyltransferase MiaA [Thermodesulfobacteriota bacterium]
MNSIQNIDLPPAVVICGPTGIGKTSFAIDLARRFEGKIIGADSMQLYRHMDIGTAKPTPEEQAAVTHYMVNIVDPDKHFDAEMYADMAYAKVLALTEKRILPFIVGGTGLYIKALIHGLFESVKVDAGVRKRLKKEAEELGGPYLHARLKAVDPAAAGRIHTNDTYRIVRALEIFETTGRPISDTQEQHRFEPQRLQTVKIGLHMDREALYQRIDQRVDIMLDQGLLAEVKGLLEKEYSPDLKSMKSLGYRHMAAFLKNEVDWEETVRTLKRDTRRYAKRQMTWFKADPEIVWMGPDELEGAAAMIAAFKARCG